MNTHHLTGVTAIQAEASAQNGIFLELQDEAGAITLVTIEVEPNLVPIRNLLVRAINSAARAAKPRPQGTEADVVALPRRNGLAFGDPTRPLGGGGPGEAA